MSTNSVTQLAATRFDIRSTDGTPIAVWVDGGGPALADALKAEARRRVKDGSFFGHIACASPVERRRAACGGRS